LGDLRPVKLEAEAPVSAAQAKLPTEQSATPKQVTIDVLKQLIKENPVKMAEVAREWVQPPVGENAGEVVTTRSPANLSEGVTETTGFGLDQLAKLSREDMQGMVNSMGPISRALALGSALRGAAPELVVKVREALPEVDVKTFDGLQKTTGEEGPNPGTLKQVLEAAQKYLAAKSLTGKTSEQRTETIPSNAQKASAETGGFTLEQTRGLKIGDEVLCITEYGIQYGGKTKQITGFKGTERGVEGVYLKGDVGTITSQYALFKREALLGLKVGDMVIDAPSSGPVQPPPLLTKPTKISGFRRDGEKIVAELDGRDYVMYVSALAKAPEKTVEAQKTAAETAWTTEQIAAVTFETLADLPKESLRRIVEAVPPETWGIAFQGMTTNTLEKAAEMSLPSGAAVDFTLEVQTSPIQDKFKIDAARATIVQKAKEILAELSVVPPK
ncbi:MAG: FliG C-terminal domain-containing protein, partial [bacterium]|nr:FliG C-terminal domain-containing protein [bacterium]